MRLVRALAPIVLAAVCAQFPARAAEGDYGPVEVRKSEAALMKSVSDTEEMFLRRGYRYNSPELENLVTRIGERLAPAPTDPYIRYRFHIVRDPELNAFALPDGQIYVNTGILAAFENEAQLAAVLAHEVHHTAGHHTILEYRSIRSKVIADMVLGPITFGVSDIFLEMSVYGHSRDLEEEADRRGAPKMLEAGYDPREMPRVFEIMLQDPEEENPKRATAWSTHPQLQARVEYTRAIARDLLKDVAPASLRVEAAGYRQLAGRVSLQTVGDLIAADYPRSAVALARRLTAEDPADGAREVALGDATRALGARSAPGGEDAPSNAEKKQHERDRRVLTRREREAEREATPEGKGNLRRNLEAARQIYLRALELEPDTPEAHRGLGYALMGLDDAEGAGREFVIYLRSSPDALDKPIILQHLKTLTQTIKKGSAADDTSRTH